jgi:hypothetical protein
MILCPVCNGLFTTAPLLHNHGIVVHGVSLIAVGVMRQIAHTQTLSMVCPVGDSRGGCRTIFHTTNAVLRHLWQHHEAFARGSRPVFNALTALYSRADSIMPLQQERALLEPMPLNGASKNPGNGVVEHVNPHTQCEEPADESAMRRTSADGCDVMIGNLDPHTPARVLEALILDLGYEDVVVVAGPLVRDAQAFVFINAPPTVNVHAMVTALKFCKLFDRRLEVEIVGTPSCLDRENVISGDNMVDTHVLNIAGRPIREAINSLREDHDEEMGESERRAGPRNVADQSISLASQVRPGLAAMKYSNQSSAVRLAPEVNHKAGDIVAIVGLDSTPSSTEQPTNANRGNLLPAEIESTAPATINLWRSSNLHLTKPVGSATTLATDDQQNFPPISNKSCQIQVASPTPKVPQNDPSDVPLCADQSSISHQQLVKLNVPSSRPRCVLPAEKVMRSLMMADTAMAASSPSCPSSKPAPNVVKRKRTDSGNTLHQDAKIVADAREDDGGLTQSTGLEQAQLIKRVCNDSAVDTVICSGMLSEREQDCSENKIPVAIMVLPQEDIRSYSQDEWYGRLTPHGEDKRFELFSRYRDRPSVESESQSPI